MCCKHLKSLSPLLLLSAPCTPRMTCCSPCLLKLAIPTVRSQSSPGPQCLPSGPVLPSQPGSLHFCFHLLSRLEGQKLHSASRGKGSTPRGNTAFSLCPFSSGNSLQGAFYKFSISPQDTFINVLFCYRLMYKSKKYMGIIDMHMLICLEILILLIILFYFAL